MTYLLMAVLIVLAGLFLGLVAVLATYGET